MAEQLFPKLQVRRPRTVSVKFLMPFSAYEPVGRVRRPRSISQPLVPQVLIGDTPVQVQRARTIRVAFLGQMGFSPGRVLRPRTITMPGTLSVYANPEDDIRNHIDRDNKGSLREIRIDWDILFGHNHDGTETGGRQVLGAGGWLDVGGYTRQQNPEDIIVIGANDPDTRGRLDINGDRIRTRLPLFAENTGTVPTTIYDTSGNNRHSTYPTSGLTVDQPPLITGEEERAIWFNGTGFNINGLLGNLGTSFTLEYLIYPRVTATDHFLGAFSGSHLFYVYYRKGSATQLQIDSFGGVGSIIFGALSANTTYHIVLTFDAANSRVRAWVNGVRHGGEATYNGVQISTGHILTRHDGALPANATLDEFALYNGVLADVRIQAHAAGVTLGDYANQCLVDTPYLRYRLNEGADTPGRNGEFGIGPQGVVARINDDWQTAHWSGEIKAKTAAYTVLSIDGVILANAATAGFTVTLPSAVSLRRREFVIKKTDATANVVTVGTTSSQTIDGAATKTLTVQWQTLRVVSDGANWFAV